MSQLRMPRRLTTMAGLDWSDAKSRHSGYGPVSDSQARTRLRRLLARPRSSVPRSPLPHVTLSRHGHGLEPDGHDKAHVPTSGRRRHGDHCCSFRIHAGYRAVPDVNRPRRNGSPAKPHGPRRRRA